MIALLLMTIARTAMALTFNYDELALKKVELLHALKTEGYIAVRGIPGYAEAYSQFMSEFARFSRLPEEEKRRCTPPAGSDSIGWDKGIEKLNGIPDIHKGSFYAFFPENGKNLWPDARFQEAFLSLAKVMRDSGLQVLVVVGLPIKREDYRFHARALDYSAIPKQDESLPPPNWCGKHCDFSALTAITRAQVQDLQGNIVDEPDHAGLHIEGLGKAEIPSDCLGFQVGETAQLLTERRENEITATKHYVKGAYGLLRRAFALFFMPPFDYVIESVSESFPNRYRPRMTFGDWFTESLKLYS